MEDFTKATGDELLAKLGGPSLAQSHLAWQAIGDRGMKDETQNVSKIVSDPKESAARRIAALWALEEIAPTEIVAAEEGSFRSLIADENRNLRREGVRAFSRNAWRFSYRNGISWNPATDVLKLAMDPDRDPGVRSEICRVFGNALTPLFLGLPDLGVRNLHENIALEALLSLAREPLPEPIAPATRNGKPIKVREAYEREFERYLVRLFLEQHPKEIAKLLDSPDAQKLPVESRLLASLALEPKASASRVAQLLPKLTRPPGQEEVLRLVQFLDEPGVGDAVKAALGNPATSAAVLESLLAVRTKLDAAKLTPLLTEAAATLLASKDAAKIELGVKLAGAFKLAGVEPALVAMLQGVGRVFHPPGSVSNGTPSDARCSLSAR